MMTLTYDKDDNIKYLLVSQGTKLIENMVLCVHDRLCVVTFSQLTKKEHNQGQMWDAWHVTEYKQPLPTHPIYKKG